MSSDRNLTHRRPHRSRRLRHAVTGTVLAAVAVGAGGVAATVPQGQDPTAQADRAAAVLAAAQPQQELGTGDVTAAVTRRVENASRSATRSAAVPVKQDVLTVAASSGGQAAASEDLASGDPKTIAQAMLPEFGFSGGEWSCLESLWEKESGWDPSAENASSGAYGIPQALPGSKMASAGADWAQNPATQIRWGLGYIRDTYGSPCSAWGHSESNGWY